MSPTAQSNLVSAVASMNAFKVKQVFEGLKADEVSILVNKQTTIAQFNDCTPLMFATIQYLNNGRKHSQLEVIKALIEAGASTTISCFRERRKFNGKSFISENTGYTIWQMNNAKNFPQVILDEKNKFDKECDGHISKFDRPFLFQGELV